MFFEGNSYITVEPSSPWNVYTGDYYNQYFWCTATSAMVASGVTCSLTVNDNFYSLLGAVFN